MAARLDKNKHNVGRGFYDEVRARYAEKRALDERHEERLRKREIFSRSLAGRANGSIDPWYGCYLWDEMVDYAVNFTYPWSTSGCSCAHEYPADIGFVKVLQTTTTYVLFILFCTSVH